MKRLSFRFLIGSLTFVLGISAVWRADRLAAFVPPDPHYSAENIAVSVAPAVENKARFHSILRGCGFGYSELYETDDGQNLSEGSIGYATAGKARATFNKRKKQAVRVLEISSADETQRVTSQRMVLIERADKSAPETVSILSYDGGQFIFFINGPSLDLVLEFEKYLKGK
jgi:hypothetical protein